MPIEEIDMYPHDKELHQEIGLGLLSFINSDDKYLKNPREVLLAMTTSLCFYLRHLSPNEASLQQNKHAIKTIIDNTLAEAI